MTEGMRPESFLPTIKCSTCGREIDMMALADHVCGPPPRPPEQTVGPPAARKPLLGMDPAIQNIGGFLAPQIKSPDFSRPSRTVPPRIDAVAANRPFAKVDQLTPQSAYSNYSDAQSSVAAPVTPSTQVTTPSSMFSRKPFGRTPSPPSPNLASNFDSAFPLFPSKFVEKPQSRDGARSNERSQMMPLRSPGINVMQRMNTVAPGPFGAQRGRQMDQRIVGAPSSDEQRNASAGKQFRNQGGREHFRKQSNGSHTSAKSEASIDRMNRLPGDESLSRQNGVIPRPIPSAATDSVDRYLDDLPNEVTPLMLTPDFRSKTFPEGQGRRFQPEQQNSGLPSPSAPPSRSEFFPDQPYMEPARPSTSGGSRRGHDVFENTAPLPPPEMPNTLPPNPYNPYAIDQPSNPPPSGGRGRSRTMMKPSISNSSQPTGEAFEDPRPSPLHPTTNGFNPYAAPSANSSGIISAPFAEVPPARSRTVTRPSGPSEIGRFDPRLDNAPPVPSAGSVARQPSNRSQRSDRSHIPTNSDSSYASSKGFTPATSDGSMSRKGSNSEVGRLRSNSNRSQKDQAESYRPEPPSPQTAGGFLQSLDSPTDPAIQKGSFKPPRKVIPLAAPYQSPGPYQRPSPPRTRPIPSPYNDKTSPPRTRKPLAPFPEEPRLPTQISPPRRRPEPVLFPRKNTSTTQAPVRPPVYRQPAPVSKGECRGCRTEIYGKSVKAADGRLTGRYHKECFVCKTCQAPFTTAEFYVHSNAPYCERHYHELNGSICRKCNRGIEGQYLDTDGGGKYHAACFCCSRCMVRLREDYYEVDGRPVCDRHAFAQGPSRLGVGGGAAPTAERRRTRLMMI
ncbi:hypothetical protein EJ08DRAFT_132596 [Tothia fuscella]|uniref:LIM zinc-binding domain-containing protein n=1 Tax=Tothia fuscella TaxID=1048955 RepID=A0A9P4NW14_9PEZI|nr:hypothetical protein EJ08DRAFT_132596 [Tothia fuscella]